MEKAVVVILVNLIPFFDLIDFSKTQAQNLEAILVLNCAQYLWNYKAMTCQFWSHGFTTKNYVILWQRCMKGSYMYIHVCIGVTVNIICCGLRAHMHLCAIVLLFIMYWLSKENVRYGGESIIILHSLRFHKFLVFILEKLCCIMLHDCSKVFALVISTKGVQHVE